VNENQHQELQTLRKHISSCFSQIDGFLLPHPGLRVATDPAFEGQLADIESLFLQHLATFVPRLLAPENVVVKRISGNEVKAKEVVRFFKAYMEIFKGDEMPEPKSMLKATSEANNLASLSESKDAYVAMMESVCGGDQPYINEHVLDIEHFRIKDHALDIFSSRRYVEIALVSFSTSPYIAGRWGARSFRPPTGNSWRKRSKSRTSTTSRTTKARTSSRLQIHRSR